MSYDDNAEFWVQIIREKRDKYRTALSNPAVISAVGPADGLSILASIFRVCDLLA